MAYLLSSCTYQYVCCAVRSGHLQLEFVLRRQRNGEIAGQKILARVAVRVCMYVPIAESAFVSHVVWRVRGLEALNTSALSRAYFKAGAMPAISHDFRARAGGLKSRYLNLAKRLRPIIASVRSSRKRFLCCTSSFKQFVIRGRGFAIIT